MADHPKDVCYCGDYRKDHEGGIGPCRLNGLGHGMGSVTNGECREFRAAKYAALNASVPVTFTKTL